MARLTQIDFMADFRKTKKSARKLLFVYGRLRTGLNVLQIKVFQTPFVFPSDFYIVSEYFQSENLPLHRLTS